MRAGLFVMRWLLSASVVLSMAGCRNPAEVSEAKARDHVRELSQAVATDVGEIRKGLPLGAACLQQFFGEEPGAIAEQAREQLDRCRGKVQDLRVAKATFFALADLAGQVIRSDRDPDLMAGSGVLAAFPKAREALHGKYGESHGSMPEAAGVKGKPDGQWVAFSPVESSGEVKGIYLAGWSWSAYAYRLEFALRNSVLSSLQEREKEPLTYAFVVTKENVYGAPVTPQVSSDEIHKLDTLSKAKPGQPFSTQIEITGRMYGLAVGLTPELGPGVGVGVLRSET